MKISELEGFFVNLGGEGDTYVDPREIVAVTSESPYTSVLTLRGGGRIGSSLTPADVIAEIADAYEHMHGLTEQGGGDSE